MKRKMFYLLAGVLGLCLTAGGCVSGPPKGVEAVEWFEAERYVGTWYEIARLDHPFERGLSHVTAEYYSCDCPGRIGVINQGWNEQKQEWQTARGRAEFLGFRDVGALKVTFFWPIYAGYYVIALDEDYHWAMVTSSGRDYLWILARTPDLDEATLMSLLARAEQWGFAVEDLIFPAHQ
jgi:apolipoprotein D and lipocalin family protein